MVADAMFPKQTRNSHSGFRAGFIPYLQNSGVIVKQVPTHVKYFFNFFLDFLIFIAEPCIFPVAVVERSLFWFLRHMGAAGRIIASL